MPPPPNPFSEAVKQYDSEKLIEILNSPGSYSSNLVSACRREAKARGFDIPQAETASEEDLEKYLTKIREMLNQDASYFQCEKYLMKKNMTEEQMLSLMDNALRTTPLPNRLAGLNLRNEKTNSGILLVLIIIIVFILLIIIK